MTVIALTSAKGSPGVTTIALALAWAWPQVAPDRRVLVVDADMAGGDLAPGYLRGAVSSADGVLGLAAARPTDLGGCNTSACDLGQTLSKSRKQSLACSSRCCVSES